MNKLNILKIIEQIERFIVWSLVIILLISLLLGTIELSLVVLKAILDSPILLINSNTLFKSFGLFLVIVIGLELLKSIKSYLVHGVINPAFVLEVAIIALGNKLITMLTDFMSSFLTIESSLIWLCSAASKLKISENHQN